MSVPALVSRLPLIKPYDDSSNVGFGFSKKHSTTVQVAEISPPSPDEDHLQVSPYITFSHLLDLRSLKPQHSILTRALSVLEPLTSAYATAPYQEAFNWGEVHSHLKKLADAEQLQWWKEKFYVVVFRSRILDTTSRAGLGLMDEKSHAEGMASGGLFKYWFGTPDAAGRNLATCVWRNRDDAVRGSRGEHHRKAARETMANNIYAEWRIERFWLVVEHGATELRFEEFSKSN